MAIIDVGAFSAAVEVADPHRYDLGQTAELQLALGQIVQYPGFANAHAPQAEKQGADQPEQ